MICPRCHGSGEEFNQWAAVPFIGLVVQATGNMYKTCSRCYGRGKINEDEEEP